MFLADAKVENGHAWIGGFLEMVPGCHGPWFLLEVTRAWAPRAFSKDNPNKVIASLELLATLIAVKLWVPESNDRQVSKLAVSYQGLRGQSIQRGTGQKGYHHEISVDFGPARASRRTGS